MSFQDQIDQQKIAADDVASLPFFPCPASFCLSTTSQTASYVMIQLRTCRHATWQQSREKIQDKGSHLMKNAAVLQYIVMYVCV